MKFRWETEFKETEIGEIPKDWEITNLGDNRFFKILPSGIKEFEGFKEYLSTSSVEGSEIVKIEEVITYDKRPSRANMQPVENSVWLARMINSPKFLKANKDLIENKILSTGFLGIQTKAKETCDYLFYYIQTREFQEYKDAFVTGAVQESLTNESAKDLLVIIPPLPEQSRIATVLSWFDDLIEVKKRQNEILEKTAMAIFKSWFIDFEPFRDGEFVYSEELGKEIPKGWEVKKLGEVVRIFKGISYKSDEKYQEYIEGAYVFITLDNFMRGGGFKTEYSWIKSERIKPSHLVKESDLIIALTDMTQDAQVVGAPAIITLPKGFEVGVISLDCMKIDPITEHLKYYLYIYLKNTQEENSTFANGVNVLHLIINNFLSGKLILIPPSHILQSFHSLVEPLFQKIILNQKQIMTLRKIRDTLLPLLVFGKLRIEEV
jgi:type I restriction enzyme S subunit